MAFANFSVIALGSLLMGIPILLHLMMRRKPRHQVFPAMRFLQQRQVANQRQLRLRHWLLLAMRVAAIGFLAALFARPSVDTMTSGSWLKALLLGVLAPFAIIALIYAWSERKGAAMVGFFSILSLALAGGSSYFLFQSLTASRSQTLGDQNAPVIAALVFDTSPRMGLLHQSKTRLKEAQSLAKELLQQLPKDSEVAIVDASGPSILSPDLGSTVNMLDSLQVLGYEYPLLDLVRRGFDLVAGREDKRPEVYVFTDLSEAVWGGSKSQPMRVQMEQNPSVSMFVLDVGVEQPRNVQLGDLRLSGDSVARGQVLQLDATLQAIGVEEETVVTVEVAVEQSDPTRPVIVDDQVLLPESTIRQRLEFTLTSDAEVPVSLDPGRLPAGLHHGRVQVVAADGLPVDDTRYFTVEVRPPSPVLILTSSGAESRYLEQAISPTEFRERDQNAFDCQILPFNKLPSVLLDDYAIVALLDPEPLAESNWKQLETFVQAGGSLAIFLGRNAGSAEQFNSLAGNLLPGNLAAHWRTAAGDVLLLSPKDTSHPILAPVRDSRSTIAWDQSPIFRHWTLGEWKPNANVILRYSNNQPAVIESMLGSGTVLTMTTPISDPRNQSDRPAWNHLPTSAEPLPFFAIVYGMFPYLANQSTESWNHRVGQIVEVAPDDVFGESTWQLFTPAKDWQNLRTQDGKLSIHNTNLAGQYRLKLDQETALGFSTNLPASATQLQRIDGQTLRDAFGESRFTLTRGIEELTRGIGQARVGRELFPFLMLCVVGILAMEYLVSNRFYGPPKQHVA